MEEEIELIPVEGKSGFYRDPESTALFPILRQIRELIKQVKIIVQQLMFLI